VAHIILGMCYALGIRNVKSAILLEVVEVVFIIRYFEGHHNWSLYMYCSSLITIVIISLSRDRRLRNQGLPALFHLSLFRLLAESQNGVADDCLPGVDIRESRFWDASNNPRILERRKRERRVTRHSMMATG